MSKPTSIADYLEEAAQRAQKRGEHESAVDMLRAVLMMRSQVSPMPVDAVLTAMRPARTVNSAHMDVEHRVNMSRTRASKDTVFMEHIRSKGYSLNRLAKAVNMSPSSLSQARRKPNDELHRRIPEDKAAKIEKLTGWPAKDWP